MEAGSTDEASEGGRAWGEVPFGQPQWELVPTGWLAPGAKLLLLYVLALCGAVYALLRGCGVPIPSFAGAPTRVSLVYLLLAAVGALEGLRWVLSRRTRFMCMRDELVLARFGRKPRRVPLRRLEPELDLFALLEPESAGELVEAVRSEVAPSGDLRFRRGKVRLWAFGGLLLALLGLLLLSDFLAHLAHLRVAEDLARAEPRLERALEEVLSEELPPGRASQVFAGRSIYSLGDGPHSGQLYMNQPLEVFVRVSCPGHWPWEAWREPGHHFYVSERSSRGAALDKRYRELLALEGRQVEPD